MTIKYLVLEETTPVFQYDPTIQEHPLIFDTLQAALEHINGCIQYTVSKYDPNTPGLFSDPPDMKDISNSIYKEPEPNGKLADFMTGVAGKWVTSYEVYEIEC